MSLAGLGANMEALRWYTRKAYWAEMMSREIPGSLDPDAIPRMSRRPWPTGSYMSSLSGKGGAGRLMVAGGVVGAAAVGIYLWRKRKK